MSQVQRLSVPPESREILLGHEVALCMESRDGGLQREGGSTCRQKWGEKGEGGEGRETTGRQKDKREIGGGKRRGRGSMERELHSVLSFELVSGEETFALGFMKYS